MGTSGDYAPFSLAAEGGEPSGFDVEVARRYAKERGLELEFVRFRWPNLLRDLEAGRFDLAMSGITVVPRRSLAGRFSVPVAESGAVLLTREPERWKTLDELDRPDLRIGVNAGGYLEQVARRRFPRATLLAIPSNQAVREALLDGKPRRRGDRQPGSSALAAAGPTRTSSARPTPSPATARPTW